MFFSGIMTLLRFPDEIFYTSCPKDNCKKKVNQEGENYFCSRCGVVDGFKPRFLANLKFCDDSGELWVSCIGDNIFKQIFEKDEQEIYDLKVNDMERYLRVIRSISFTQFKLKISSQKNQYMQNNSIKYSCTELKRLKDTNYEYYATQIENMLQMET